jgi:hypothetical protein
MWSDNCVFLMLQRRSSLACISGGKSFGGNKNGEYKDPPAFPITTLQTMEG